MPPERMTGRRRAGAGWLLAGLSAAYALAAAARTAEAHRLVSVVIDAVATPLWRMHSAVAEVAGNALMETVWQAFVAYPMVVYAAMLCSAGGLAIRAYARARARDGRSDPIAGLRRALELRPWIGRMAAWIPGLSWVLLVATSMRWLWAELQWQSLGMLASVLVACAVNVLASAGIRALTAPLDGDPARARASRDAIGFSAVAVTPRTQAMVGAVALAAAVMTAWVALVPLGALRGAGAEAVILAFVVAVAGAAAAFRSRSRAAVGVDGVRVEGTSGAAFYAYRDLDEARARGADLELVRGGRVVLRLQLHGDDSGCRDEVLGRMQEAIVRARESSARGAELLVQATSSRRVATASLGAADYRQPAVAREQLWEIVEGTSAQPAVRAGAAEALAVAFADGERARLRVAATRCAEPAIRVALEALAADPADEEAEELEEWRGDARSGSAGS
jgi:hypothetical protein